MKKVYIAPEMLCVSLTTEPLLGIASDGSGNRLNINNSNASGAAEGRQSAGWDDEE